MLVVTGQIIAVVAVLANAVVYGTDVCGAAITRSVYRKLDDATVTISAGWGHYYGDKRMPVFGVSGVVTAVLTLLIALVAGQIGAAVAAGITVAALLTWLAFYVRIAKPINTKQTAAAQSGIIPADARALQDKWDSILKYRVTLQFIAIAGLCAALILF
ncbi:DUF1772 domain-containing protein [Nocardia cyriacigeorgica]|uniref:DUF1772 domain-containing protein n=1 Tax=Nocardia cyriacigeorgica TaxID=135487 RepID=A0A6P1D9Z7_9NOCA|nr:DUF1772 domain-containing protein [Nocardia cyriacigeorgica]NEW41519.1 DUF1772 domain-containing protein [Nocardia cyriacigeorgica]NEW45710.1 DUF1772 domain-containing protein [Nocardia cyriacigeorgica]NEW52031.1 DUF1772 domain-containing protein [Nocardia cyriacigeorgica]NEW55824.1 DUF1772 domain-containing protein [Nocardia cyriacigeorgica]